MKIKKTMWWSLLNNKHKIGACLRLYFHFYECRMGGFQTVGWTLVPRGKEMAGRKMLCGAEWSLKYTRLPNIKVDEWAWGGGDVRQNRQYAGAGGSHCRGPPRSSSSHLSALCLASLFSFHSPSRAHPAPCFSGYSGDSVFLFFIIIVFVAQHILTLYTRGSSTGPVPSPDWSAALWSCCTTWLFTIQTHRSHARSPIKGKKDKKASLLWCLVF